MAPFDYIAEKDMLDDRLAFYRRLMEKRDLVVAFIDEKLGWNGTGRYDDGFLKGSFNFCLDVKRGDSDEHVLIRFPCPGSIYTPWRDEKVRNEVMVMEYLREHTSIPIPRVRHWGLGAESPQQLGPFIIMDFMPGEALSRILQLPNEDKTEPIILDPNIDDAKLDFVYEQIAGFLLELSRLRFPRIGSISRDTASGRWEVTGRPLTYDMNEVVSLGGSPADQLTATVMAPFDRAKDYFEARAQTFLTHAYAQRNIAGDSESLIGKHFVSCHCFPELIPTYVDENIEDEDNGNGNRPFPLFCDDLRPSNMLVDPDTLRITAVLDLEFTNAMPAQYTYDVPWWLLLKQPSVWLEDENLPGFLDLFEPRKEQFLRAMERAESSLKVAARPPRSMSARMRESWDSGRFWFNLASRSSFDVNAIYWERLHRDGLGDKLLDAAVVEEKSTFIKLKKEQFEKYLAQRKSDPRLSGE
ncbi:hypothetical protein F4778DRAFT_767868 [Xylariomycetidae sp. FL2044]|nr:hypothetical protein F4778DRAFT_767868 [Xylariomycetidae sp. FL2044]